MLRLKIVPAGTPPPINPGPDDPGVSVWRDHDGTIAAFGGSTGDRRHWMELPGVGSFEFGAGDEVVAHPRNGAGTALVEDAFRRTVLPMALQALGREVLHASGVVGPRGVVALCAVSETGKSTLAYGLSLRGYPLWGDDAVALELSDGDVTAVPLDFRLSLRPDSVEFFGGASYEERAEERPAALATICILERCEDEVAIDRLAAADAFPVVLAHGYCFELEERERKRRMMETYLELVQRVDVARVRFPSGLDRLPRVLDAIERTVLDAST